MFHVSIDHTGRVPMYQQIYQYIVSEIRQGNLSCHSKLPSGRELAQDLNISRNTVNMAYAQLESEGYIEALPKRGYFVKELDGLLNMHLAETSMEGMVKQADLERYQVDFSPFGIDLQHAPYNRWQKLMKEVMLDHNADLFQNGAPQGDWGLRRAIKEYLHRSRGVQCTEEQIIIGAGTDYLLMLLTRILPERPGIAVENPVYMQAYRVFQNFNYPIYPIPLNDEGLDIQALRNTDARLVFVTPSHQFPLGIVMPINRRLQLLNWSYEQEDRYIIEDDYDSEFRYQGKPIPALQGIDTRGKVIYLGTFSKAIAPSIRIGYMVLPQSLWEQYQKQASFYATTVSRIEQEIVRRFIAEGYFERHLNRMRGIYRAKNDYILDCLSGWSGRIERKGYSAGLHLLIEFPEIDYTEQELEELACRAGVKVYPLSSYYITGGTKRPTILLGYANLSEQEIEEGLRILKSVWGI